MRWSSSLLSGDRWAPALVALGYALLVLAWTFGNPLVSGPDEGKHYVRALGIANGELVGEAAVFPRGDASPDQLSWLDQNTRLVYVPPGLSHIGMTCMAGLADVTAACQADAEPPSEGMVVTNSMGVYHPLPYLLPALATRIADDPVEANYWARLASALPAIAMIALASFLAWRPDDRHRVWLVGLTTAVTPMVIFLSSTLNPSALEITAGLAFGAGMIRLSFDDELPTWAWTGIAISGSLLALSRAPAPIWVVALALIPLALRGLRGTLAVVGRARKPAALAGSTIGVALVASLGWSQLYGPSPTVSVDPIGPTLSHAFGQFSWVLRQQVGIFGFLEHGMPELAYKAWLALLAVLIILALLVGTRRQRIVLTAAVAIAVATPALLLAAVIRHTGFEVQGRHVLALTIVLPLLAAAILRENWVRLEALAPRLIALWFAAVAMLVHIVAWLSNARRFAVGSDGPIFFFNNPEWMPPLGWLPWLVLALSGAGVVVVVAASQPRSQATSYEAV